MKLRADFFCVPPGEVYPRTLAAGEECPPALEAAARALGKLADDATSEPAPANKAERVAKNKAG